MKRVVLTFGLIAGAIMAVMMLVATVFQDNIGFDRGAVVGYASMVAAFLMVFFGIRAYREQTGGTVSFGRGLAVGLLITLVATVCYVATWELIYYRLSPGFADKYAAYEVDQARKAGASEERIAAKTKEMQAFKQMYDQPLYNIAFTFIEPLPVGVIMTLVAAGVLRRGKREEG